jgi:hypothetical protein
MKRLLGAAVLGTEYDDTFTVESAWRKLQNEFPETLQAAQKMCVDDARAQWTTYTNLHQWFDDAKQDLINMGLVIDQEIRCSDDSLLLELDFRSDEVRRRIINMDKTHHDLSITGNRGGPRSVMYHNPRYQRGSKRCVKSSLHVTGVYATNAAGETLPPMYIFDSGAKIDDNFRVKLKWLEGLPNVTGRFGCPSMKESSSFFSVQTKGSMDDSLLNEYIDKVVLHQKVPDVTPIFTWCKIGPKCRILVPCDCTHCMIMCKGTIFCFLCHFGTICSSYEISDIHVSFVVPQFSWTCIYGDC